LVVTQLVRDLEWYQGHPPPLVPAVELGDGGRVVLCPFCSNGVHIHGGPDGIQVSGCDDESQARYEIRGLAPAVYVPLLLRLLGFGAEQVSEMMGAVARAYEVE